MNVWGPARVRGQGHERYFLLVVDDYSCYTTVFPLRSKGEVPEVLIDWIRGARRQLSESFGSDLPVLRLHSDRGGEFSSDLLRAFCGAEGIRQMFTLPASPQQNGIAERRIGMFMDYAAHQINLQPRVTLPETTPTLRWTGKVGDASVFRVWGSRAFVCDTSADKLSSRVVPCVFLGFPPDAPGWQFYHPTSRRVLSSQDVTFDESVSYYHLFPYRTASLPSTPPLPSTRYSSAFVCDTSADKLSSRVVPCVFLGFPPDAPGWQFYHPTSRRVLSSQDVTFDESGPAPSGVSQVDPAEPVEVAVDSSAARGAEPASAGTGGAEPGVSVSEGAEPGSTEPGRVEPGGAEPGGAESGSAEPGGAEPARAASRGAAGAAGAASTGGAAGVAGGAAGVGAAGGAVGAAGGAAGAGVAGGAAGGTGAVGGPAGVGAAGGAGAAGLGGARTGGTGAAGAGGAVGVGAAGAGAVPTGGASGAGAAGGTGASGAAGVVAGDPGAEGDGAISVVSGGAARPRPYYVPLLQQVLGLPPSPGPTPPLLSPPPVLSQSQLQPTSPLPGPSPYSGPTRGLTEHREPESRPVSPESRLASLESGFALPVRTVRAGRRVSRPRPPPVPGTHSMTLRPSTAPQRVPLPSPPASSLCDGPDPESDSLRAASPTVTLFLATAVTDPLFESTAASALVAELVDFAAAYRLDFATSLVAEAASASVCPTSVGDPDAPDISTPRSYAEAIEGPYFSQWHAAMDVEMASWKSTGTYVDEAPPCGANIVSGMWIFRVKRPPGSPPVFKARYVARGFSQRQGVDFLSLIPLPQR
ncbi:unnamed protein product [Closterium sp. NIES-54]